MADTNNGNENREETSQRSSEQEEAPERGLSSVSKYILSHKVDTALWATRGLTICFVLSYLLPIFATAESSYQKILISNAATSALRLHQRVRSVSLTTEFLTRVIAEDSAHYLLYSMIFLTCAPITMVTLPIALFAVLHFASNSLHLCDAAGENSALGPRFIIGIVEVQQRNILRGAAFIEIFLLPVVVLNLLFGRVNLAAPFLFFQFLSLRYSSHRNPYTRTMFYELRVNMEQFAAKPAVPAICRNLVHQMIGIVCRLAPQTVVQQQ